ncbi:MAG: cation:proton antiporter [Armatimonadota bacterium]
MNPFELLPLAAAPEGGGAAHDALGLFLPLLLIFISAKIAAEIFERLRQPAVVGEILAGVVIGPQVLGLVRPSEIVHVLSELGVLFLLFSVGLETRPSELRRVGKPAVTAAVGGVIVPFLLGYALMLMLGATQPVALFVGTAMVATSVGITARILAPLGLLTVLPSRIILGAAILDDILGLLALAVVSGFAQGGLDLAGIGVTVVTSLLFVGVMLVLGGRVLGRARPLIERMRIGHALFVGAVALCLGLAVGASVAGIAPIIGAFLAGTAFAEFSEETGLHHRIENLTEFFLPFFLVSIGMQLELTSLAKPYVLALCAGITVLAVIGKLVGSGLPLLRSGRTLALQVGWGMVPRGEVGIVVAQLGMSMGILNADLYAVVLFMAVATTLLAPPFILQTFRPLIGTPGEGEGVVELEPGFSTELGDYTPPEVGTRPP